MNTMIIPAANQYGSYTEHQVELIRTVDLTLGNHQFRLAIHPALATPGEEERADTVVALHQSGYRIALLEGRLGGTISRARLRDYSYRDIRAETERAVARLIARLGLSKVVATLQRSLAEHKNLNG